MHPGAQNIRVPEPEVELKTEPRLNDGGLLRVAIAVFLVLWGIAVLSLVMFASFGLYFVLGRLSETPWNAWGNLHVHWFVGVLPGAVMWMIVLAGIYTGLSQLLGDGKSRKVLGGILWLRTGFGMAVHPLVAGLAILVYSAGVGSLMSPDPHQVIASDRGAEKLAGGYWWHDCHYVTDVGVGIVAERSEGLEMLRIAHSPEISRAGLVQVASIGNLLSVEFRTEGPEQAKWGDREAVLLTSSATLKRVDLWGFGGLTDQWLDGLKRRCPELVSIKLIGPHLVTEQAIERARRGGLEVVIDPSKDPRKFHLRSKFFRTMDYRP